MEAQLGRIEELVAELQVLKRKIDLLESKNIGLEGQLESHKKELALQRSRNKELEQKLEYSKQEMHLLRKKHVTQLKHMENRVRRDDLFQRETNGTIKSKKEQQMIDKMVELRSTNRILIQFLERLGERMGFDSDIAQQLCEAADGCDEKFINIFIDGAVERKERE